MESPSFLIIVDAACWGEEGGGEAINEKNELSGRTWNEKDG